MRSVRPHRRRTAIALAVASMATPALPAAAAAAPPHAHHDRAQHVAQAVADTRAFLASERERAVKYLAAERQLMTQLGAAAQQPAAALPTEGPTAWMRSATGRERSAGLHQAVQMHVSMFSTVQEWEFEAFTRAHRREHRAIGAAKLSALMLRSGRYLDELQMHVSDSFMAALNALPAHPPSAVPRLSTTKPRFVTLPGSAHRHLDVPDATKDRAQARSAGGPKARKASHTVVWPTSSCTHGGSIDVGSDRYEFEEVCYVHASEEDPDQIVIGLGSASDDAPDTPENDDVELVPVGPDLAAFEVIAPDTNCVVEIQLLIPTCIGVNGPIARKAQRPALFYCAVRMKTRDYPLRSNDVLITWFTREFCPPALRQGSTVLKPVGGLNAASGTGYDCPVEDDPRRWLQDIRCPTSRGSYEQNGNPFMGKMYTLTLCSVKHLAGFFEWVRSPLRFGVSRAVCKGYGSLTLRCQFMRDFVADRK